MWISKREYNSLRWQIDLKDEQIKELIKLPEEKNADLSNKEVLREMVKMIANKYLDLDMQYRTIHNEYTEKYGIVDRQKSANAGLEVRMHLIREQQDDCERLKEDLLHVFKDLCDKEE